MPLSYTVLMTACVDPGGEVATKPGNYVARVDPLIRLEDYKASLRHWLTLDDRRISGIVFADNSQYCLDDLVAYSDSVNRNSVPVEFISLPRCIWPDHIHYGYCELRIIEQALARSTLLKDSQYFIKATGRLRFNGIGAILDVADNTMGLKFSIDAHDYRIPFKTRRSGVNTQLMIFHRDFYLSNLLKAYERMQPWIISHIEDLLFLELIRHRGTPGALFRFGCPLAVTGHCASTNKPFRGRKERAKYLVRNVVRRIAPRWWFA